MAKVISMGQRSPADPLRLMHRGVFTQKKKVWEAMESLVGKERLVQCEIYDDVAEKRIGANQSRMTSLLTKAGRAIVLDEAGEPLFLLVESETNVVRDWDVDEDGDPVYNPVKKA